MANLIPTLQTCTPLQTEVDIDGMSIKDILERDEIAGARDEKSHAAETAILDFRPYRMRQQPLPREGLQREQEIKESLRREDRGVAGGLIFLKFDCFLK